MPSPRLEVRNTRSLDGSHIWKTLSEWYRTYWSGLDSRIYLGDQLLDEVIELQWTLQEAVLPLYGYHSYVFDSAIHGARRVQGAFRINYTQDGYLFDLLRKISQPIVPPAPTEQDVTTQEQGEAFRIAKTGEASLETFVGITAKEGAASVIAAPPGPKLGAASVVAAGPGRANRLKFDPSSFRRAVKGFQDALWGPIGVFPNGTLRNPFGPPRELPPVNLPPLIPGPSLGPLPGPRPRRIEFGPDGTPLIPSPALPKPKRPPLPPPIRSAVKGFREEFFDGNTTPVAIELVPGAAENLPKFEIPGSFDINIVFGSVDPQLIRRRRFVGGTEDTVEERVPISTAKKIIGIEITGVESVYDDSGRPILETYTFIAQDII